MRSIKENVDLDYETPEIAAGAIKHTLCQACGAKPGELCSPNITGHEHKKMPPTFAHIFRRMDYVRLHTLAEIQSVKVDDGLDDILGTPAQDDIGDLLG